MRDDSKIAPGWPAIAFLLAIVIFGVVLIGHALEWPIYTSVLVWWGFVFYTTFHPTNHTESHRA
jgi:hypothetical protein